MSDVDGTCEYVLDPDDPETWGGEEWEQCYVDEEELNEDGVWTCPHDAEEGEDFCIFHLPVEQKDNERVVDAFVDALDEASKSEATAIIEKNSTFIGARFGRFDLNDDMAKFILEESGIQMAHCKIKGDLNWADANFDVVYLGLDMVRCAGNANFSGVEFGRVTHFQRAEFEKGIDFSEAEFRGDTRFKGAKIKNGADFSGAEFQGETYFNRSDFEGADFSGAEFQANAEFRGTEFREVARFQGTEFNAYAEFALALFRGHTNFRWAEFRGDVYYTDAKFEEDSLFQEVSFEGVTHFRETKFNTFVDFSGVNLNNSSFEKANLTDSRLSETDFCEANLESALLSRATLFGTDLRGAKLSGAVLGDVRIDEDTKFLGHPTDNSDSSPHTLSAIRSRPTCVYDPDYEENNEHEDVDKAKSVYRALEELGGKHARPRLQARSFVRRQDLQKKDYWDDATAEDASFEERFIAGARWSRAKMARATLLYGESPWRVIGWSLGIILSFALLFPLGGWMKPEGGDPITYAQIASNPVEILNAVYYSTLTYTALGFGDFKPVGLGKALTTVETGLGAVMLALLVFILGRRAAR